MSDDTQPTIREVILASLKGTNQFRNKDRSHIAGALEAADYDRADEDDWVSGAVAVLVTDGEVIEDPYSAGVSYYLPEDPLSLDALMERVHVSGGTFEYVHAVLRVSADEWQRSKYSRDEIMRAYAERSGQLVGRLDVVVEGERAGA